MPLACIAAVRSAGCLRLAGERPEKERTPSYSERSGTPLGFEQSGDDI